MFPAYNGGLINVIVSLNTLARGFVVLNQQLPLLLTTKVVMLHILLKRDETNIGKNRTSKLATLMIDQRIRCRYGIGLYV